MQNKVLWGTAGGLLVGLLAGYIIGFEVHESQARRDAMGGGMPPGMGQLPPPGMGQPPPPAMGQAGPSPAQLAEYQQRIDMNQRLVAKDPKNLAAWIALGNDYFDTRQHQKAIDAYAAALKLQPNNPDVLTDQGVMYEQLADFDRALACFEQAQKLAPGHVQSAYNIGVVWANHKNDPVKAAAAWKKVVQMAPTSPQAAEARQALAKLGVK
jgi:tetratricopeptide (TPR) repeat protein